MQETWPALPLESWRETRDTLHMWTQIVGKICLALDAPIESLLEHRVPRHATRPDDSRDAAGHRAFTMTFDFVAHRLAIECSDGGAREIALEPQTVADFYRRVMRTLRDMSIEVASGRCP